MCEMTAEHLWVLEEAVLVVSTASSSVHKWIVMSTPRSSHDHFLPGLMETKVGCVDEATQDKVREVSDKIIKIHPAERDEDKRRKDERLKCKFCFLLTLHQIKQKTMQSITTVKVLYRVLSELLVVIHRKDLDPTTRGKHCSSDLTRTLRRPAQ